MKKLLTISALFSAALMAGSISAQQQPAPAPPAVEPMEITPELKEKFIGAYADILEIQVDYTEQLEAVTEEAEANALQQEAQMEMQEAVVDNELTIQQYNQIIQMAANDPELQQELQAAIQENS